MTKNTFKIVVSAALLLMLQLVYGQEKPAIENPKTIKNKGFERTANPYTKFVYKSGFRNYTVEKIESKTDTKTTVYNELRFHSVYSQMYTRKAMFDNYGAWTKDIASSVGEPILVWRNVKLFPDSKETFTVFANGVKDFKLMYASVYVFDSKGKDCLEENHPMRSKIIKLFSEKIWNLTESKNFETAYKAMLKKKAQEELEK